MAGLIGALAMGAVGGAGKGISENAQADMAFNYDQMREQMRAEMEQRIYERGRADKATDYAQQRTDKLADDEKGFVRQKGLIAAGKDPSDAKLKALQVAQAEAEIKLPPAVKLEYSALQKKNEINQAAISKSIADGSYDEASAAKLHADIQATTTRMRELLKPYQGDAAPKGKGAFNPDQYKIGGTDKKETPATQAAADQPQVTPSQRLNDVKSFISNVDTRDSASLAAARTKLTQMKNDPAYQYVDVAKLAAEAGIRL